MLSPGCTFPGGESVAEYPDLFNLSGVDQERFINDFIQSKPVYDSFEDFLSDV